MSAKRRASRTSSSPLFGREPVYHPPASPQRFHQRWRNMNITLDFAQRYLEGCTESKTEG